MHMPGIGKLPLWEIFTRALRSRQSRRTASLLLCTLAMSCASTPPTDVAEDHIEAMLLQGRLTDDRAAFYAGFCGKLAGSKDAKFSGRASTDFIYAPRSTTATPAIRSQADAVPA